MSARWVRAPHREHAAEDAVRSRTWWRRRLRSTDRRRERAQAVVEFALIVPLFLLLVAGAVDVGRAFFGFVTIENAAKEGAFYGATNPRCNTTKAGCTNPSTVSWKIAQELSGLPTSGSNAVTWAVVCKAPDGTVRDLNANNGPTICQEGDRYTVSVAYPFPVITPLVGSVIGNPWTLHSSATAVVMNTAFDPDATPPPTPAPTPTMCDVPKLVGTKKNSASGAWTTAGFTGTITYNPNPNGNWIINSQSPAVGPASCSSSLVIGGLP